MTQVLTEQTSLQQIQTGLQAFETRRDEISALAESTKEITLTDWKDRDGLKNIGEGRKGLKAARVQVQKEGKAMRDLITPISKMIKSKEDELVGLIEPEEDRLQGLEIWAEQQAENERQAAVAAENARIQARIDKLAVLGFQIDYSDIKAMSDETFEQYLTAAQAQYEKEQAEKAEQERIAKEQAEAERVAAEREREKLEAERKELEGLRAQQADAQRIINEQNAKLEAERRQLEADKAAAEAAKQKEEENARRAEELKAAQMKAAEDARLKTTRLEAERKEKERIAAEKKAARQPDKVKIEAYIAAVKAIATPELKSPEAIETMGNIQELIKRLDDYATLKISEL